MATPSSGGDSDKAIPQSLQPPSLTECWAWPPQEDIVDQSPCSALLPEWSQLVCAASDSALLQQEPPSLPSLRAWLQQEDIVHQEDIDDQLLRQEFDQWMRESPCSASDYALFHPPPSTLGDDEEEEVGTRIEGRGEGEMEEGHLNSAGCLKKGKRKVRSPRGERGNKKTTGARIEISGETRSEGRGEGEMEDGHLNSAGFLFKGKRKVRSPRGGRGNKKTTGARIEISLDDILEVQQMRLEEAAKHLKVGASTLKRVCRGHGIHRWPPRMGKNCINQSGPSESLLAVDQEQIAQQRPDTPNTPRSDTPNTPRSDTPNTPRSDMSWSSDTNSVIIKARYVKDCTIKFPLPRPWVMVELEQQVQKRLKLEAGTYYIKYKDEDDDLIIIACDEDLQDYISRSIPRGTTSIEVLLVPK